MVMRWDWAPVVSIRAKARLLDRQRDLGVAEGGFGSYVKTYKPWFIGRDAYVAREKERKGVVIRFTFDEQRVRMAHNGDPVMNANGERIGFVTSCAIDGQRFITGQAYVDLAYTKDRHADRYPSRRQYGSSRWDGEGGESGSRSCRSSSEWGVERRKMGRPEGGQAVP